MKIILHQHDGKALVINRDAIRLVESLTDADKERDETGKVVAGQSKKKTAVWFRLGDNETAVVAIVAESSTYVRAKMVGDIVDLVGVDGKRFALDRVNIVDCIEVDGGTVVNTSVRNANGPIRLTVSDSAQAIYDLVEPDREPEFHEIEEEDETEE